MNSFLSALRTFHALIKSLYTYERVLRSSQSDEEAIPLIILMFDQILKSGFSSLFFTPWTYQQIVVSPMTSHD